ncbi:MAG: protease modulator HflC [Pseudomonadota bacterium]
MPQNAGYMFGLLALVLVVLASSMFTVSETQQVLVLQFGEVRQQIKQPGLHFKMPLIQQTKFYEKRILHVDPPPEDVILADQKRMRVDVFARYQITDMLKFFQALNNEATASQRLSSIINASVRSQLGRATIIGVLSEKRDVLMEQIQNDVNTETGRFGIRIVDVRIVRADLPEQVMESTFNRMRSEREREAREARAQGEEMALEIRATADKEKTILLAQAIRDSQIIRGQGDEAAIKLYGDAFNRDPSFYAFYRSLEAYRTSLADPSKTLVLSPSNEFFRHFQKGGKP